MGERKELRLKIQRDEARLALLVETATSSRIAANWEKMRQECLEMERKLNVGRKMYPHAERILALLDSLSVDPSLNELASVTNDIRVNANVILGRSPA